MKTAIGIFRDRDTADAVVNDLIHNGFSAGQVNMIARPATLTAGAGTPGPLDDPGRMAGTGAYGDEVGREDFLKIGSMSDDFAAGYSRAVRQGWVLVTVTCNDGSADRAVDVMERHDPIGVQERQGTVPPAKGATGMSPVTGDATVQTGRDRSPGGGPRVFVW